MEKRYLITIYVTTEEEQAINYLYKLKGWTFLKLGKPSLFDTPLEKFANSSAGIEDQPKNDGHDSESTISAVSEAKQECPTDSETVDTRANVCEQIPTKRKTRRRSARKRRHTSKVDNCSDDSNWRSPVVSHVDETKPSSMGTEGGLYSGTSVNNVDELSEYDKVKSEYDTQTQSSGKRQTRGSTRNKQVTYAETVEDDINGSGNSGIESYSSMEDSDIDTRAIKLELEGKCDICRVHMNDCDIFTRHQQMDCGIVLKEAKSDEGYFCTTCCMTFSATGAFVRHLLNGTCNSASCGECGLVFTTVELYQQHQNLLCNEKLQANKTEAGYYCKGCRSTFKASDTFIEHKLHRSCIGDVLKCEFCGKSYPTRRRHCFSMHIRKHLDDRQYVCQTCGKRYLRYETLRDHMRLHTGERPYKCSYCPMEFTTGAHKRNHEMLKHIEVPRSHVCHKCGATFKFRARLTHHLDIVHLEERNFPCESCDKKFKSNTLLKEHMKIHINTKDHVCDVCGKGFITQKYLNSHMRRHTEGRTHICDDCGKAFFTRQHLLIHERTHTGSKPYLCTLCEYRCTCRGNLCKHIKTVHNKADPGPYAKRIVS